jgi:hypothetical protein
MPANYPRAAWRLDSGDALDAAVIWPSHILIRYAGTHDKVCLNSAGWSSVLPPATRTQQEALELAQRIAAQAAQHPDRFAELARLYSEDLPRRDEGGALGSMQASVLAVWPEVLDVIAALRPGETSRVVATEWGFHIFKRSAPPPEEVVSGSHIVIGHDAAPWLHVFARTTFRSRTRDEALALANDVYRQALAEPSRFAALVDRYSEHLDVVVGGDFGAWSTREPIPYPGRVARLRELAVGAVGAPIETHLGFEIILRTPARARTQYRAIARAFRFDPFVAGAPSGRAEALAQAEAANRELLRDPHFFERENSQGQVVQWEEGRGVPALTLELDALASGMTTRAPVYSQYGFLIARKLEPEPVTPETFTTELPGLTRDSIKDFITGLPAQDAVRFLVDFAARMRPQLELSDAAGNELARLHDLGGRLDDATPAAKRLELFDAISHGAQQLLAPDSYRLYADALESSITARLLETRAASQG